jgi:hypothetical protein
VASSALCQFDLQPKVNVLTRPTSTPDPSCQQDVGQAPPRLEVKPARPTEMPRAEKEALLPSRAIFESLQRVQEASETNDLRGFADALAQSRAAAASIAAGNQKKGVDEILRTYADVARVWDFSMTSRTGAFFDSESQGGTLLMTLRSVPGFEEFILGKSFVDPATNQRYYPSRETLDFLAAYSKQQLARLIAGQPLAERRISRQTASHAPQARRLALRKQVEPAPAVTAAKQHPATGETGKSTQAESSSTSPVPAPSSKAPTPSSAAAGENASTVPQPATATASTAASETVASAAASTSPATASSAEKEPAQRKQSSGARAIIPIIMAIVGVGVLWLLIRASK